MRSRRKWFWDTKNGLRDALNENSRVEGRHGALRPDSGWWNGAFLFGLCLGFVLLGDSTRYVILLRIVLWLGSCFGLCQRLFLDLVMSFRLSHKVDKGILQHRVQTLNDVLSLTNREVAYQPVAQAAKQLATLIFLFHLLFTLSLSA